MTVGQLIAELQKYKSTAPVHIETYNPGVNIRVTKVHSVSYDTDEYYGQVPYLKLDYDIEVDRVYMLVSPHDR